MIFVLSMRISLILEDLSLSVSELSFVIRCCFMALMSERCYVRQQKSMVVVWPM